jgi:hypothetical protein
MFISDLPCLYSTHITYIKRRQDVKWGFPWIRPVIHPAERTFHPSCHPSIWGLGDWEDSELFWSLGKQEDVPLSNSHPLCSIYAFPCFAMDVVTRRYGGFVQWLLTIVIHCTTSKINSYHKMFLDTFRIYYHLWTTFSFCGKFWTHTQEFLGEKMTHVSIIFFFWNPKI